jgi:probable HAF family extracellular repeat protein
MRAFLALLFLIRCLAASSPVPGNYTVNAAFSGISPQAINNYGQVVGQASSDSLYAFVWTPLAPNIAIGNFATIGLTLPTAFSSTAIGINDLGQIVGSTTTPLGPQGFLWTPSSPNASTGAAVAFLNNVSSVIGINSGGQIAGIQNGTAFLWTPSSPNGTSGTVFADARLNGLKAINDYGQAIINSSPQPTLFTPSSLNGSTGSFTMVKGLPGSANDQLVGINAGGTILGQSNFPDAQGLNHWRGFLWTPTTPNASIGTAAEIPTPAGFISMLPTAMNASGQVVGLLTYITVPSYSQTTFLFSSGAVYDLSTLSTSLGGYQNNVPPVMLNDRGEIEIGDYLLTPGPTSPTQAPETVPISIAATPQGEAFTVAGAGCSAGIYRTPQTLYWMPGSACTVAFSSPDTGIGERNVFNGWQDGVTSNSRVFTAPSQAASYTGSFLRQYYLTVKASPPEGGTVTGSGWYTNGATATLTATAAPGYQLQNWPSNSVTVTVISQWTIKVYFALISAIPPSNYLLTYGLNFNGPDSKLGGAGPLNDLGQMVGTSTYFSTSAFLWTPATPGSPVGSMIDIGGLPGSSQNSAVGINNQGQVIGISSGSNGQPFLWSPTTPNGTAGSITSFLGSGSGSLTGINNYGQVAGLANGNNFIWTPSTANGSTGTTNTDTRLSSLAGINDYGQAVINAPSGPMLFTPATPNSATGTFAAITGLPNAQSQHLVAINAGGTVLGWSCVTSGQSGSCFKRAFLWTPATPNGTTGAATAIPMPSNYLALTPTAFNAIGQVVGNAERSDGSIVPFLYTGGNIYDLSTLGTELVALAPIAINIRGEIVMNGSQGPYLLIPNDSPVPAPGTVAVNFLAQPNYKVYGTNPLPSMSITVSGSGCSPGGYITPQVLYWTPGASCTVTVLSPESDVLNARYVFAGWQDSAAGNPRVFAAPSQAATYTVTAGTQYLLTSAASPSSEGTVSAGGWFDSGSAATFTATPAPGYRVASWSVGGTAVGNSIAFMVRGPQVVTAYFAPATPTLPNYYVSSFIGYGYASSIKPINNAGQIVGTDGSTSALLWEPSAPNALTGSWYTIPGLPLGTKPYPSASAIDNQGQVAGATAAGIDFGAALPFLWTPSTKNGVSGVTSAFVSTTVDGPTAQLSINDYGQIAGSAFLWTPSTPNGATGTLNTDPRLTGLRNINNYGQAIINNSTSSASLFTPTVSNGMAGAFSPINGLPGALSTSLVDLNSSGVILGVSCLPPVTGGACLNQMFLWTPASPNAAMGTAAAIPPPSGFVSLTPTAMNSHGEAVGIMAQAGGLTTPFLYSSGTVYDLTQVDWTLRTYTPTGINDLEEIVLNQGGTGGNAKIYIVEPQPPPPPQPTNVNPATGSGSSQTIAFTFTDPRGWQDLDVVNVLINSAIDGRNACYLAYSRPLNVLYLVNDAGAALLPGLANSQCSVSLVGTPAGSGNSLTVTVSFTFTSTFAGNKVIYTAARDLAQRNSGWQALGSWQIPGAAASGPISAVSVAPASGLSTPYFTFTFSDTKGWQDLGVVNILINDVLDGRNACYLAYSRPLNVLYLVDDSGSSLLPGVTPGSSSSTNNSQCFINAERSSVSGSGNNLTLTIVILFYTPLGNQVIYLAARDTSDANNSGWQPLGTLIVQ